jgi:hypothetical protein
MVERDAQNAFGNGHFVHKNSDKLYQIIKGEAALSK